jgi:thioredoxin-related protein
MYLNTRINRLQQHLFILLCFCYSIVHASDLVEAFNLQSEAKLATEQGRPLIILFSRNNCPYCEVVRRNYLYSIRDQLLDRNFNVVRQINIDRDSALIDFFGRQTTHAKFAAQQKIKLVPVVAFYGSQGEALSSPIVGTRIPDFYLNYLNDAISESIISLQHKKP